MHALGFSSLGRLFSSRTMLLSIGIAALSCVATSAAAAPALTYPNQAYVFGRGIFQPVPGFWNMKAVAVEGSHVLGVTRDGHVIDSGLPEGWLDTNLMAQITNAVAVGLSYVQAAALTAD